MTSHGSLRLRILAAYLLTTVALLVVLGLVHQRRLREAIEGNFAGSCQHLAEMISRLSVSPIFAEDREGLERVARQALSIPSLVGITFLDDQNGTLLTRNQFGPGSPGNLASGTADPPETPQGLASRDGAVPGAPQPEHRQEGDAFSGLASRDGAVPEHRQEGDAFSGLAIVEEPVKLQRFDPQTSQPMQPQIIGRIRLSFARTEVERQISAMQFSLQFDLLLFAVTFGLLIVILEQWVTRPLNTVIGKVQSIARGEFGTRVEVPASQGEITALCESVNHMAASLERYTLHLQTTIDEKTQEIAQRERVMMFQEKMASLGRISASIAHEINNPLNFISLGVDFLDDAQKLWISGSNADPAEVGAVIRDVRHGIQRTKAIIDSLRTFARTDENLFLPFHLDETVQGAMRMYNHEFKDLGIVPEVDCSFSETINGSEIRIQQILINLIGNSLDALRGNRVEKPRIAVRAWKQGNEAHLLVDDNGPGIPEVYRPRMFEPFFTTKPPGKGTGLGLALCFEFANREGGRIFLGESALGGACFELVLPIDRAG